MNKHLNIFTQWVSSQPNKVAIVEVNREITYQQLDYQSNQVSNAIINHAKQPRVAILLSRSIDAIVCMLGVMKTGGTFCTINPELPKARIQTMIHDIAPDCIITNSDHHTKCPTQYPIINSNAIGNTTSNVNNSTTSAANPAYIMFTSGTTGNPKGVLISYQAFFEHNCAFQEFAKLTEHDRVLHLTPLDFDVSLEEIFPTLLAGGTLIIYPLHLDTFPATFHQFIHEQQITVMNLPTSYWDVWFKECVHQANDLPESCRMVLVGSEIVHITQCREWFKRVGNHVRWGNAYGLTETTITSTIFELHDVNHLSNTKSVPIGKPLSNTEILILNHEMESVSVGEIGKLFIGGKSVALGYLNQEQETYARFIDLPHQAGKWYRTGDNVKLLADGSMEFIGRSDDQLKIQGIRVEAKEIEANIIAFPQIREAHVQVEKGIGNYPILTAYYVSTEEKDIKSREIRAFLSEKVPAYMIPMKFVALSELPRTKNHKVDTNKLAKVKSG